MKKVKTSFDKKGRENETKEVLGLRQLRMSYYTCLCEAIGEADDDESLVRLVARKCHLANLPEEACVQRTIVQERVTLTADEVRKIFRAEYMKKVVNFYPAFNRKERIARGIEDFIERRYDVRYNTVKKIDEYRVRGDYFAPWHQLTDRDVNQMAFEHMREGGEGWPIDVRLYLESGLIPQYNPLTVFLSGCGRWTQCVDHIGMLARRIPTDYEDWETLFHRWFLAMVAQWLGKNKRFSNMLVPMLIGAQGTHKSTFCRMILPPALADYFIDDIKMDNAEQVERVLARMALVNIDEYNAKTEREQAKIKRVLAEKDVQVRKMRSDQYVRHNRNASFIATTNSPKPLTDPTGSRRYICCPVTGIIDTEPTVNYRQLYAQAVYEVKHGVRYWPDPDEEARMVEHNQQYQQQRKEELLLTEFFEPMERNKEYFMTLSDIEQSLRRRVSLADLPTLSALSKALASHFQAGAVKGRRGWYMRPRES